MLWRNKSNLSIINELEQSMKLRNTLESVNPALKPFFRGKAAVVEAGTHALLKLVTYDKSTNSCSLADEFDYIVERERNICPCTINADLLSSVMLQHQY